MADEHDSVHLSILLNFFVFSWSFFVNFNHVFFTQMDVLLLRQSSNFFLLTIVLPPFRMTKGNRVLFTERGSFVCNTANGAKSGFDLVGNALCHFMNLIPINISEFLFRPVFKKFDFGVNMGIHFNFLQINQLFFTILIKFSG